MRKSRFTEAQIIGMIKEQEAGLPTAELCRKHGLSPATFYKLKAKYGGMDLSDAKRLKQLEEENARLKRLVSEGARTALAASNDIDPFRTLCSDVADRSHCRFGQSDGPLSYAIIGDSHAAAIRPAIVESGLMDGAAGTLYWSGACPFLDGAEMPNVGTGCADFKSDVWDQLEANPDLQTVILAGRWPYPVFGTAPERDRSQAIFLLDEDSVSPSEAENVHVFVRAFERTLARLDDLGLDVVIVGSTPEPGFDVPRMLALSLFAGIPARPGVLRSEVAMRAGVTDDILARIASNHPTVRFISIWDAFCDDQWCRIEHDGGPTYYDTDHLSLHGAMTVAAAAIAADLHNGSDVLRGQ